MTSNVEFSVFSAAALVRSDAFGNLADELCFVHAYSPRGVWWRVGRIGHIMTKRRPPCKQEDRHAKRILFPLVSIIGDSCI